MSMNYKRLTTTQVVNGRNIKTVTSKGKVTLQDLIDRLAELEDKIEAGALVEFPRIIHPNKEEWFVQQQYESGIIYNWYVYYSEAEAEKKLEEIKNGNNDRLSE